MSSHREAPEMAKDPVADNTDVYAFVSPDKPDTVTIIANYIPLQQPDGGPNFYEFGDDVLYEIVISNGGQAKDDIRFGFRFRTEIRNKNTFLYNTGQINNISDKTWNRPQFYDITRTEGGKTTTVATNLACPPVNVGKRSTPNYAKLAGQAVYTMGRRAVFAGQRADAFHVDLGSIFDLGALRPVQHLHLISMPDMNGVNSVQSYNVHTIAIQVPMSDLSRNGDFPKDPSKASSVIGIYATASRQASRVFDKTKARYVGHGPWEQVSRLGNPLFNEVIVPMARKDEWNSKPPSSDGSFAQYVDKPELQTLLPALYPTAFPHLKAYTKSRADLDAILLTGLPSGVVTGFQNYTGATKADMLRLNLAIPPAKKPNNGGLVAGDAAGFPNGRRIADDVVTIELRAIAGATIPLVDPSYKPDGAAGAITDGTTDTNAPLLTKFPYLGLPGGGFQTKPGTTKAS